MNENQSEEFKGVAESFEHGELWLQFQKSLLQEINAFRSSMGVVFEEINKEITNNVESIKCNIEKIQNEKTKINDELSTLKEVAELIQKVHSKEITIQQPDWENLIEILKSHVDNIFSKSVDENTKLLFEKLENSLDEGNLSLKKEELERFFSKTSSSIDNFNSTIKGIEKSMKKGIDDIEIGESIFLRLIETLRFLDKLPVSIRNDLLNGKIVFDNKSLIKKDTLQEDEISKDKNEPFTENQRIALEEIFMQSFKKVSIEINKNKQKNKQKSLFTRFFNKLRKET